MNYPSHHQAYFFKTLVSSGVDLKVGYYGQLSIERQKLGWQHFNLEKYELVATLNDINQIIHDYSDFIHIVPGYGSNFTRKLAIKLSRNSIKWLHWSEKSSPGIFWYKSYFVKKWYANLVNKYALGALSQGVLAEKDFRRWGINKEIKHLSYSIKPLVDVKAYKDLIDFKRDRKAFLYLGQLINRKGVDLLIQAFSSTNSDNWCLILVGSGSEEMRFKKLAEKLNVSKDRILFFPSIESENINKVLTATDVFVLPSRNDGWGVVLNEACSLGKAIIASDMVGASWHLVDEEKNGYRFKSNDSHDLYSKMMIYIENNELEKKHGDYSRNLFEKYSSEKMVENLKTYLGEWLKK